MGQVKKACFWFDAIYPKHASTRKMPTCFGFSRIEFRLSVCYRIERVVVVGENKYYHMMSSIPDACNGEILARSLVKLEDSSVI